MKWLLDLLRAIMVLVGCIVVSGAVLVTAEMAVMTPYRPVVVAILAGASIVLSGTQFCRWLLRYYLNVRGCIEGTIIGGNFRALIFDLKYFHLLSTKTDENEIFGKSTSKNTVLGSLFGRGSHLKGKEFLDKSQVENTT